MKESDGWASVLIGPISQNLIGGWSYGIIIVPTTSSEFTRRIN